MALDEAVLESVACGACPPTLRLYGWNPPCLSIGYAQSSLDVDLEALSKAGWELVRRPTGGKAILHTDELTYAIVGPADHPLFRGGVPASYQRLSFGLMAGLQRLGIRPQLQSGSSLNGSNPICFQVPGAYELIVDGHKLMGSAQLRRARGVLQHGSLPLQGDIARICLALNYPSPAAREAGASSVRSDATTVERAIGHPVSWEQAAGALANGFRSGLKLELEPADLTDSEVRRAGELERQKYGNLEWSLRV